MWGTHYGHQPQSRCHLCSRMLSYDQLEREELRFCCGYEVICPRCINEVAQDYLNNPMARTYQGCGRCGKPIKVYTILEMDGYLRKLYGSLKEPQDHRHPYMQHGPAYLNMEPAPNYIPYPGQMFSAPPGRLERSNSSYGLQFQVGEARSQEPYYQPNNGGFFKNPPKGMGPMPQQPEGRSIGQANFATSNPPAINPPANLFMPSGNARPPAPQWREYPQSNMVSSSVILEQKRHEEHIEQQELPRFPAQDEPKEVRRPNRPRDQDNRPKSVHVVRDSHTGSFMYDEQRENSFGKRRE